MFGEFIKQIRQRQRLGLREFCLANGCDPSNWSKIEREVLPPPRDEDTLRSWARQLGLKPGSEDWLKFFDYAAVDSGRIPEYILKDAKLVAQLPVFFRTISGQKPSREDLEKLVELTSPFLCGSPPSLRANQRLNGASRTLPAFSAFAINWRLV